MIIEITKIKSILIKHNALDSFIHNSGAPEKEKEQWRITSAGTAPAKEKTSGIK